MPFKYKFTGKGQVIRCRECGCEMVKDHPMRRLCTVCKQRLIEDRRDAWNEHRKVYGRV